MASHAPAPGLVADVRDVFKHERAASLVPAGFLLVALADALPVPTDAGYFYVQKWLEDHKAELSDREFWAFETLNYFGWDFAWYMSGFAATYVFGKTLTQKGLIALAIISGGVITAELLRFAGVRMGPPRLSQSNPVLALPATSSTRRLSHAQSRATRMDLSRQSIIFLDWDGVLNSAEWKVRRGSPQDTSLRGLTLHRIDPDAVARLNAIVHATVPDAAVVLSSSWRYEIPIGKMQDLLAARGFTGRLIGRTPLALELPIYQHLSSLQKRQIGQGHHERGLEIERWLALHGPVRSFVILDDDDDMAGVRDRLVHTDYAQGLTDADAARAIAMLRG